MAGSRFGRIKPTRKGANLLSVYDGELMSARDFHIHFTTVLRYESVCVVGVTVDECPAHGLEARSALGRFPEHTVLEFTPLPTSSSRKDAAKQLAYYAMSCDW